MVWLVCGYLLLGILAASWEMWELSRFAETRMPHPVVMTLFLIAVVALWPLLVTLGVVVFAVDKIRQ